MDVFLRNLIFAWLLLPALVVAAPTSAPAPTSPSSTPTSHQAGGEEHIVIIDKNAPVIPQVAEVLNRLDLHEKHPDVRRVFNNSAFQGFAASMKSHCLDLLANMSDVSTVEKAVTVSRASIDTRPNAPWGLQRISTASSVGGSPSALAYTYSYSDSSLGSGSDVYIIDTGIYTEHNVFGGRAKMLWSFDGNTEDKDGHGTHVAGTAAGAILGIASNANIYGVKALDADGGGWSSNVVAGIDYVLQRHDARRAAGANFTGSVMSMSLATTSPVTAITQAVNAAVEAGIHACIAAGNSNTDACSSSPASTGGTNGRAITVGAIDMNTQRASFSNYGSCVDLYAPGVGVVSSWIGGQNMINILDGTSMATPHVTGIVAYAMSNNSTLAQNPGLMKEWIRMVALPLRDGTLMATNGAY
ncbi:Alkaline protease 2 [Lecanosticta acicola]|uniref:Alkaline protease 2 n=1 Tax=Lecanosticta acicola TaxID=111012 RepID=A0AAI9E8R3_9PEZI|nr:Alkaline protease 2 [Lecanosticta acicola]